MSGRDRPSRRSFQRQAIALAIVPAVLLAIVLTLYFTTTRIQDMELGFQDRGRRLAEELATTSQYGLASGNHAALQLAVTRLAKQPDVSAVSIQASLDDEIFAGHRDPSGHPFMASILVPMLPIDDFNSATHIIEQQLGVVTVTLSHQQLEQRTEQIVLTGILITLLSSLLSGLFAAWFARRALRPVRQLASTVGEIERGHLEVEIPTPRLREWRVLADGLRAMAGRLKLARDDLESQVVTATSDLHQSLEELEVRNVELDLARKQAQQADQAKSAFLANVSHEVRTPLTAIVGLGEMVAHSPLDAQQRRQMALLLEAARGLNAIIRDILDVSALESRSIKLLPASFDIRSELEQSLGLVATSAHHKSVELLLRVYDDVPAQVITDPSRLRQIVLILLSNALKFTDKGEIVLRAMLDSDRQNARPWIRVELTDTGVGIAQEHHQRLFESFEVGSMSLDRRHDGTGLGLAIAKRLVSLLGGEIGVDSTLGQGSQFWFRLPIQLPDDSQPQQPDQPLRGFHIGVYDRHPESGRVAAHLFRNAGAEVSELESVTPADHLQLIWVGVTGDASLDAELMSSVHEAARRASVPIIVSLSASDPQVLHLWEESGARESQSRPTTSAAMIESVQTILREGKQQPANPAREQDGASHWRLLLVDDNNINRQVLGEMIRRMGAHADTAESGQKALRLCARNRYDAILMDLHMPGLSGIETVRRLRASAGPSAHTPVVAVTADGGESTASKAYAVGIERVLLKPVESRQLRAMLSAVLSAGNRGLAQDAGSASLHAHDPALAHRIHNELLGQLREVLPELQRVVDRQNWTALASHIHRLLGAAVYCDLPELVNAGKQAERCARDEHRSAADKLAAYRVFETAVQIALDSGVSGASRASGP